ncbi:hypothetical protein VKT23_005390 [Stygiomarasmius scandens]|uniref:PB1 domain-containing protein n=1 Tax=Marasmiellus scandens TaxID=2682957 RepID=A0ABR1JSV4_9AGAR
MTIHFKLKSPSGLTRRVSFDNLPSWAELSEKVHVLYDIPLDNVALSYIDAEEDEITMSSQEELQDYYSLYHSLVQTIPVARLIVQDLRAPHVDSKTLPTTPPTAGFRNTFGGSLSDGLPFNIDEDWQHFPPNLGGLFPFAHNKEDSLHAFVEVVDTDAELTQSSLKNVETSSESSSDFSHATATPRLDKGKRRAFDPMSSAASLINSEQPEEKPPLHVFGVEKPVPSAPSSKSVSRRSSSARLPIGLETTPKTNVQDVPSASASAAASVRSIPPSSKIPATTASGAASVRSIPACSTKGPLSSAPPTVVEESDPPLPPLDTASLNRANPLLSNDIANLMNLLTDVIASRPELSEGFRNIVRNAANGTYWPTQRDAMDQSLDGAAQTTTHAADDLRRLEEEAGRRVADSLGALFRSFAQVVGVPEEQQPSQPTDFPPWDIWRYHPFWRRSSGWASYAPVPPPPPGAHMPPSGGPHPPPPPHAVPPPPPPSRGFGRGHSFRSGSFSGPGFGPHGNWLSRVPPPPPLDHVSSPWEAPVAPPPPPPPPVQTSTSHNRQTSRDLRAQVEAAKLLYKAEKERYRADREARKAEKNRKLMEATGAMTEGPNASQLAPAQPPQPPVVEPTPPVAAPPPAAPPSHSSRSGPGMTQIVSNARGGFPTMEMFNVPRRSNTLPGHMHFGTSRRVVSDDPAARTIGRITKKLADMGFTEAAHPELPNKIKASVPSSGAIGREKEDDIVTNLLEEMVSPPKETAASSSKAAWR